MIDKRISLLASIITLADFKDKFRKTATSFTRNRKLPFAELIFFLINSCKKSLQIEIDKFFDLIGENMEYSKQAMCKARLNILPEGFKELNNVWVKDVYKEGKINVFNDYRILAIDGTTFELPYTEELKEEFGEIKNNNGVLKKVLGRGSILYDVENTLVIDGILDKYSSNERTMAISHLETWLKMKKEIEDTNKDLVIFDRGYPSLHLIGYMKNRNIDFLMRITHSFLKETNKAIEKDGEVDEIIEINITKSKLHNSIRNKEVRTEVKLGDKIKVRVVKIMLDTGNYEYLVTSLLDKESFKTEMFKELYFKRWGIETTYDKLKNTLEIENFSGIKSIVIRQEFYINLLVNNMCSEFIDDVQKELDEENEKNNNKYEYIVNRNYALGTIKGSFADLIFAKPGKEASKIIEKIKKRLKKNKTPIRDGRVFPRDKDKSSSKYPMTKKRVF